MDAATLIADVDDDGNGTADAAAGVDTVGKGTSYHICLRRLQFKRFRRKEEIWVHYRIGSVALSPI